MTDIAKKPIKITETILRDAHQSLIATRMTTEQMLPIVDTMDKVGYHSVECWGGATFDASLRFLKEDPWERLRKFRDGFKNTKLQMLFRGQNILGYRPYADDVVEYFVQKSIANGIDIIRIFDCLNDMRNLQTAVKAANKEKGHAQVALSYTLGDAYTLEYWTDIAKRIEDMGADSICIKDMAGLLLPNKATELVTALKETVKIPIDLHTHYTSGVAAMTYMKAVEAGCDIAKEVGMSLWSIGSMLGLGFLAASVIKGKFPITKVGNWLTNLTFDAKSPIKSAVNDIYEVVKKSDKVTVQKFQKALVSGNLKSFLEYPQNKKLKEAVEPLLAELGKIGRQGLTDAVAAEKKKDISSIFSELFASHFKQTALAKWTRNMISQCTKLWAKSKAAKADVEISKEVQEQLGMNFNYKNYKTLINTGLVAGVPLLGTIIAIPYAFNAWLTSIQKKAGKIGIMKAMDKIDDPRVFASEIQPQTEPQPLKLNNQAANSGNLLEKVKQQAV